MLKFLSVRVGSFALAALFCFGLARFMTTRSDFDQRLVILAGLFVTLAVSLNLINGITGQFSLGHIAFYAVGAYTAAYLSNYILPRFGLPAIQVILIAMVAGAIMSAIAGFLVGLPSLRLRGDYLAIVTLGVGEIVRIVVQNQAVLGQSYGKPVNPKAGFIWLTTGLAILTIAICRNIQVTAKGLNFLAVREDEIAASAMGVNVTKTKVVAFVIGSAFAGAAGALQAHYEGFISPGLYTIDYSILIVTMVVLGGTGSITGSVVAALALFAIPEYMRSYPGTSTGNVLAILLAVTSATAVLRAVDQRVHGGRPIRAGASIIALLGIAVVTLILQKLLGHVEGLTTNVEGNKLRQVIPAITLVVMMLLRPQGIFGRAEFGWGSLFGRKNFQPEVAS